MSTVNRKQNLDVFMLSNGEVFLYLSSRWYKLSGDRKYGESRARKNPPATVVAKLGSLKGTGNFMHDFFEVVDESTIDISISNTLDKEKVETINTYTLHGLP